MALSLLKHEHVITHYRNLSGRQIPNGRNWQAAGQSTLGDYQRVIK